MGRSYRLFDNEAKVDKIGGRLANDYYHLRGQIEYINDNYSRLLFLLELTAPDDLDAALEGLAKGEYTLKELYTKRIIAKIEAGIMENPFKKPVKTSVNGKDKNHHEEQKNSGDDGKTPQTGEKPTGNEEQKRDKSNNQDKKRNAKYITPEQKERRELHRRLYFRFKDIIEKWRSEYNCYISFGKFQTLGIEICKPALYLKPDGRVAIDVLKYIELYQSYIAADESKIKQLHQAAADAINRFFNGAVAITDKELSTYFRIENGIIEVNPTSVNIDSYSRLGGRRKIKIIKTK